jgi:hypothetical protein
MLAIGRKTDNQTILSHNQFVCLCQALSTIGGGERQRPRCQNRTAPLGKAPSCAQYKNQSNKLTQQTHLADSVGGSEITTQCMALSKTTDGVSWLKEKCRDD